MVIHPVAITTTSRTETHDLSLTEVRLVLTEYEGEGVLAEVHPGEGGTAGGRGEGRAVSVGNHRHLVLAAGQGVGQAD